MTTMNEPDEITGSEDMINLNAVTVRIKYLEAHDCGEPDPRGEGCDSAFACPSCYGEAEEELAGLRELEDDMRRHTGGRDDRATAIRESYLTEFVQDEAEDIAGIGPDSYLHFYVRWDDLADARTMDMTSTTYRGSTYYITT